MLASHKDQCVDVYTKVVVCVEARLVNVESIKESNIS